jgi:hypothetical protein
MASRSDDPFGVQDKPALEERMLDLAGGNPEATDSVRD